RPEADLMRRALAGLILVLLLSSCTQPEQRATFVQPAPRTSSPARPDALAPRPVPGKVMLGAYLDIAGKDEAQSRALRRQQLGRDLRILHRYYAWTDPLPDRAPDLAPDTILLISWDGASYASINNGSQDALIGKAADALARYHQPVFLRWAWEMNGNWFAWGGARNGN